MAEEVAPALFVSTSALEEISSTSKAEEISSTLKAAESNSTLSVKEINSTSATEVNVSNSTGNLIRNVSVSNYASNNKRKLQSIAANVFEILFLAGKKLL